MFRPSNGWLTTALKKKLIINGYVSSVKKPMTRCWFQQLPDRKKSLLPRSLFQWIIHQSQCRVLCIPIRLRLSDVEAYQSKYLTIFQKRY